MLIGILHTNAYVATSNVHYAEPRLLVIDAEPRLSFSEKKRARAEPSLDSNQTSRADLRL